MVAPVDALRARLVATFQTNLERLESRVDWDVAGVPFHPRRYCYHGGASFSAIGDDFLTLERKNSVVNADVLDAWFDPAPSVILKLAEHLAFALKTSPPTNSEGLRAAIAVARNVSVQSILPGAGSSDLIFAALRLWVKSNSRVLILDPMYGEYVHVLEHLIGARVDRMNLSRDRHYEVDLGELAHHVTRSYDWVVLTNPNNPTGCHVPRSALERIIRDSQNTTRWWIDETYVDYVESEQSLESYAHASSNVVVCKSMSKAYALSGARAGYLCGPALWMNELSVVCPPWAVSLPAQIVACEALKAVDYYRARWQETHDLRAELREALIDLGLDVAKGCANFLLCHLPLVGPQAPYVVQQLRRDGVHQRPVRHERVFRHQGAQNSGEGPGEQFEGGVGASGGAKKLAVVDIDVSATLAIPKC